MKSDPTPIFSVSPSSSLRRVILIAFVSLFVAACSNSSSEHGASAATRDVHTTRCIDNVSASARHDFLCDGVQFKVMLTQNCIDEPCGLIVDVHGWLSNPDEQEARSNLARAALDNGGYIVVQPGELSTPSSWNSSVHNAIVFEFMQQAMEAFAVDRKRIHFTGFSQGGWMTWMFICEHSDIIASAAPLSAPAANCFHSGTGPSETVPVLFISGTKDPLIRYYHSPERPGLVTESLIAVMYDYGMSTVDAPEYVFDANGDLVVDGMGRLVAASADVGFETLDGSRDGSFLWTRYTTPQGAVFEHLRHTNGHVYPDNPDSLIIPEDPSVWFSVGDAILQFFIRNPKP